MRLCYQGHDKMKIQCPSLRIRGLSGPNFSAFSRIRTEYRELLIISAYTVQMLENMGKMETRITPNTDTFYAVFRFRAI